MYTVTQNRVTEWSFVSKRSYCDPFNDVQLDVLFTGPDGAEQLVPAFWAGGNIWRVRFSPSNVGGYRYRTICSDPADSGLHGQEESFEVLPYTGRNPLYKHGRLRVAADKRHFEHADGKPFFWLGDTWWMGFCKRLDWPAGFQTLAIDRVKKGFNVIQIIAGPYPDMTAFDERAKSEAGFPWEENFASVNPAYYNEADTRIAYLVEMGLMPCIVGMWGYYMPQMGVDKVKAHWRNLVARYGAYPVTWCVAGEGLMPFYLSEDSENDVRIQKDGWTEVARYIRSIDTHRNIITIHPGGQGRDQVHDPSLLDFDMLQTGHGDRQSMPLTTDTIVEAYDREPRMPFINSEVCYEGIGEGCRQEVQRLMFWTCMLGGAAGHTYGANGVWQFNTAEAPYGPSPHGMSWGDTTWEDAYKLPGSANLGLGKRFFEEHEWWRFEPHPEWIERRWTKENYFGAYAGGIPGEIRVIFFPLSWWGTGTVKGIEKDARYTAYLFNPVTGKKTDLGLVTPDANGDWELPLQNGPFKLMPIYQDWVLALERVK